jgi:hypothetical protein
VDIQQASLPDPARAGISVSMRAAQRVEAILKSPTPNWASVKLSEISACIQRKKLLYSQLRRRRGDPETSSAADAIVADVKKLYAGTVSKRSAEGLESIDEAIAAIEKKMSEPSRINPFDSDYLDALKFERARLAAQQPPRRRSGAAVPWHPVPTARHNDPAALQSQVNFAEVLQVEGAFSTEVDGDHTHFVKAPITAGVQPCLIEVQQVNGTVKLIDALTVLPTGVSYRRVVDPIYALYLDVIAREYTADVARATPDLEVRSWSVKSPNDPPFACAAVSATRQSIFAALESTQLTIVNGRERERRVTEAVAELVHESTKSSLWHPRHLRLEKTAQNWRKAWAVLARWDAWELNRAGWARRLTELSADLNKEIKSVAQEKDALRKFCDSIGLKRGNLSPAKRLLYASLPVRTIRL